MRFNYTYSLKYSNGNTYTQNPAKEQMCIESTLEEYRNVVEGILLDKKISEIEGISELLDRMREYVIFADRFKNTDGSSRIKGY